MRGASLLSIVSMRLIRPREGIDHHFTLPDATDLFLNLKCRHKYHITFGMMMFKEICF